MKLWLLVLLVPLCLAQSFEEEPTSNNFKQLEHPTADDLLQLENPTIEDFRLLSTDEQATYLMQQYDGEFAGDYIKTSQFTGGKDIFIGDKFFSDATKINTANHARIKYFHAKGFDFLQFDGSVLSWNPATESLTTKDGKKELGRLKEYHSFKIDSEGEFYLITKSITKSDYHIKGFITDDATGATIKGFLDGKSIEASGVIFNSNNMIEMFEVDDFAGTQFAAPYHVTYDELSNTLYTENNVVSALSDNVDLSGEHIVLPNSAILLEGKLSSTYKGYKLHSQSTLHTLKQERINSLDNDVYIFTDEKYLDDSLTYFYSDDNSATINSGEGEVYVSFWPGNKLFDMHVNVIDEKSIVRIPDEKQRLAFVPSEGDKFHISERDEFVPLVEHSGNGLSGIINGRLELSFFENDINFEFTDMPHTEYMEEFLNSNQRSVALELEAYDLVTRFNSGNQFAIVADTGDEVTYNSMEVEITNNKVDNQFKSAADFEQAYGLDISLTDRDDRDIPPDAIIVLDQWFRENPRAVNTMDFIVIDTEYQGSAINVLDEEGNPYNYLKIGVGMLDPYTVEMNSKRSLNVFNTLTHEHEHMLDNNVGQKENENIKSYQSHINDIVLDSYHRLRNNEEFDEFISDLQKYKLVADFVRETRELPANEQNNLLNENYASLRNSQLVEQAKNDISLLQELDTISSRAYETVFVKTSEGYSSWLDGLYRKRDETEQRPDVFMELCFSIDHLSKKYPNLIADSKKVESFIEQSGMPHYYAFMDYSKVQNDVLELADEQEFWELSAVYAEQDIEKKKQIIEYGTPGQKEVYTKLAQLRCDGGQDEDCQELYYLLGCNDPRCCDSRCVIYKNQCQPC